ncbi:MAG: hypothetical protein WKH64_06975 [Chloroflexia bacterium]
MSERTRVLLDDIGTDVDDCLALAFILGSPELLLEGVTCVYGDGSPRQDGSEAAHAGGRGGRTRVPCARGAAGRVACLWAGHEGVAPWRTTRNYLSFV